jgi:hypothetical protein
MSKKNREISRAWNTWNTAFRAGYADAKAGKPNTGRRLGTARERGLYHGWERAAAGKSLPSDPMRTALNCDRIYR